MADDLETIEGTPEPAPIPEASEAVEPEAPEPAAKKPIGPIVVVVVLLLLPVLYLVVKFSGSSKSTAKPLAPPAQQGPDIPALEAAVRLAPTTANQLNLSVAYINKNQLGPAATLLTAVITKEPQNGIAWNNLCTVHMLQQDIATAIKDCNKAIAAAPTLQLAKNNLQWALTEQKKAQDAIAADEKTPPANRTEATYLHEGLNQLHVGDYPGAIRSFTAGLELNPKSSTDANNIGFAYMLEEHYREAVPWFQKAVALDPSSQLAKNNLAWANSELAKK